MHPSILQFTLAAGLLALGAVVAWRLRLAPLPVYLLTGFFAASFVDLEQLQPLPDLGLLLVLFSVGLGFGPERWAALSGKTIRAGIWDTLALPAGWVLGLLLGLDWRGALLLGGAMYNSSSAIIARLIIDFKRAAYPESETVLGVLVFEDLVIAAVLALTAGRAGGAALLASVVLVGMYLAAAYLLGPRLRAWLARLPPEPLLLLGAAFTAATAELFHRAGASAAIGAFLAGTVVASIGLRDRLESLLGPVRDLAAAMFFLSVGVSAARLLQGLQPISLALVAVAVLLKLPLNYWSGAATGLGVRGRLLTMLYLIPRGEFTLVLGAIALQAGELLVAQTAVLLVLVSVPVGALAIQSGPRLTRRFRGRRPARLPAAAQRTEPAEQAGVGAPM